MDNIYQRINAIQKEVGYVKKDTEVGFGNNTYKAVSHDAVLASLREQLVEKNIIVVPQQRDLGSTLKTGETAKGKDWILFRALYDIKYICADNPTDFLVVSVEGHGEDQNDKADGKAITYACKMAHLKLFLLATGINDEERMEEKPEKQYVNPREDASAKNKKAAADFAKKLDNAKSGAGVKAVIIEAERSWNNWPDAWIDKLKQKADAREAEFNAGG